MSHFNIPEHVFVGKDALTEAAPLFKAYGSRAFIVTGPHVAKSPMLTELKKALEQQEIAYLVFDQITGEPTDTMINAGVKEFISSHSSFIIGIGGGSSLDSAKAIALMSRSSEPISSYMGVDIKKELPALVAIPTTSGTGSEATKFTVITDSETDIKMLLKGDCLIPDIAVLNYEYTMDMPKSVTAATGLDALTHAVEAYTSKKASPLTDVYAISAVKRILKYLPIAYANGRDKSAREQMSLAAYEAGVCINNSSVTIVHGMSRPIGALFHVSHGKSNAMLLADCLGFALDGAYDRFAQLAIACDLASADEPEKDAAEKFLAALSEIVKVCEIPTLKEDGIDPAAFEAVIPKMAADAIASGSPANTRKPISVDDCIAIYKKVITN